jgi:hypothetical protein
MDKELEKYFSAYFDMFRTEGWKQLMVELREDKNSVDSIAHTVDAQDLYTRKGQLGVLSSLLSMEDRIETTHKQAGETHNEASD